jgi:hypothetical protein
MSCADLLARCLIAVRKVCHKTENNWDVVSAFFSEIACGTPEPLVVELALRRFEDSRRIPLYWYSRGHSKLGRHEYFHPKRIRQS